jgi:hypothetical protein
LIAKFAIPSRKIIIVAQFMRPLWRCAGRLETAIDRRFSAVRHSPAAPVERADRFDRRSNAQGTAAAYLKVQQDA